MKYPIILIGALALGTLAPSAEAYIHHTHHIHKVQYKQHKIDRDKVVERHPESGEKLPGCDPYKC